MDETHVIRHTGDGSGVRVNQGTAPKCSLTTESSFISLKESENIYDE